jgi:hypothetical protein
MSENKIIQKVIIKTPKNGYSDAYPLSVDANYIIYNDTNLYTLLGPDYDPQTEGNLTTQIRDLRNLSNEILFEQIQRNGLGIAYLLNEDLADCPIINSNTIEINKKYINIPAGKNIDIADFVISQKTGSYFMITAIDGDICHLWYVSTMVTSIIGKEYDETGNLIDVEKAGAVTLNPIDLGIPKVENKYYLSTEDGGTVNGNVEVVENLIVDGTSTLKDTLSVAGAASFNSTLSVAEKATFKKAAEIAQTLTVTQGIIGKSTLSITGNTTLSGTLGVSKAATLSSTLTVSGNSILNGTLSVAKDATFTSNAEVKKNLTVQGNLIVNGTTTTIDSETLKVKDNLIETNSGKTAIVNLSGLAINKNSTDTYGICYDPSDDTVKLGLGSIDTSGVFTFSGNEGLSIVVRDKLANGKVVKWNNSTNALVDAGAITKKQEIKTTDWAGEGTSDFVYTLNNESYEPVAVYRYENDSTTRYHLIPNLEVIKESTTITVISDVKFNGFILLHQNI